MEQYDPQYYTRGQQQFERDLGIGQPRLYWNIRGQWGDLLTRLMQERFGVQVEWRSDIVSLEDKAFWAGNNDALVAHIDRLHGMGAYQKVLDEVDQFRKYQYEQWLASKVRSVD